MLINTITRFRRLLRATVFANVAVFGAPHIANILKLLPTAFTNTSAFGSPTIEYGDGHLLPTAFTNTSTFGAPTIAHGDGHLLPTMFVNPNTFGALTIAAPDVQFLEPTAFTNTSAFGSPTIEFGDGHLLPTAFTNTSTFGAPTIAVVRHWSYSNAGGTGNRTGSITVTTTATTAGGGGVIANLVNGSKATGSTNSWSWSGGQSSKEIKFDFGTARIVKQARWCQETSGTSHGTWKWRGSNDDSSYTDIGSAFTLGTNNGTTQIHTELSGNTTAYRYYKLEQTGGTTNSSPWLEEVEFFIDGSTNENPDTNYTYSRGGGNSTIGNGFGNVPGVGGNGVDRSSLITVSASFSPNSPSLLSNLVDGASGNTSTDSLEIPNGLTNAVIKFDFGSSPQRVDEITWEQNTNTGQGNYDLAGSDDDSSYTTLSSNFALVNGVTSRTLSFTNTAAYRYYKLTQVSGNTSNSPWCHEIFFKTAPKTVT